MQSRPVIVDNTPLLALWDIGQFNLFEALYGQVLIPPVIRDEFLADGDRARRDGLYSADFIQITPLANPKSVLTFGSLDAGEAAVLALAIELDARLVILDERKARRYAERLNLPMTGTLGLLIAAKQKGIIPVVRPLIDDLLAVGMYLSPKLIQTVLKTADEL